MGTDTAIEWCDHTWNPWRGCDKVSEGCRFCYMFRDQLRYGRDPSVVVRAADPTYYAPLRKWREPARVFTCSWSDFFHVDADPWRAEAWDIIRQTPHLTYQILTKRHGRIARCLPPDWGAGYPNVWLGVSVEDQKRADERIPVLLQTPARVRFLSCEPLLGPVDLGLLGTTPKTWGYGYRAVYDLLHWVIVGGESGPGHRPIELDWVRNLRDECQANRTAFFFKQFGGLTPKAGGRLLDGREWSEFPDRVAVPA